MKKFQSVRGMRDILPGESQLFRALESILISAASQYGYEELRTPILEDTNLFIKSIGDGTDIVEKEMYTFTDVKKNSFTMRPEGTASCARALIEHGMNDTVNKIWYLGPFFRHERPQKGRYRQFHQFGAELIGIEGYQADYEIISLVNYIWMQLNISPTLKINTIGSKDDRKKYIEVLSEYFNSYKSDLSENEQKQVQSNPLRILDSKNKNIKEMVEMAPKITKYISKESILHFDNLLNTLEIKGISYERDEKLVRGLDYYNRTVFEYIDNTLETQNTICAGGRYDSLFESLCDKTIPALGFAIGIERLLEYTGYKLNSNKPLVFYMAVLSEEDYLYSESIANSIRKTSKNYLVSNSYNYTSLKAHLKKANKLSANYCVIIGEEEIKNKCCQIKNMDSGNQENIRADNIENYIQSLEKNRNQKDG
jgi:histidyl-tRNA synthetase